MNERNIEKLTTDQKSRATEITRILSRLPEKEQEKIYYFVKCAELFDAAKSACAVGM